MKYLTNSLFFLGLFVVALVTVTVITGQEAQAKGERTNALYGLGYCSYKMPAHIGLCVDVFWRRLTDKDYERCMMETKAPDICL